jgi:hypothetical protein
MPEFVVEALAASADSIMLAAYGRKATEFRKLLELAQQEPQNSFFVCLGIILVLLAGWFAVRALQRYAKNRGFSLTGKLLEPKLPNPYQAISNMSDKLGSAVQRSLGPFKSVVLFYPEQAKQAGENKLD